MAGSCKHNMSAPVYNGLKKTGRNCYSNHWPVRKTMLNIQSAASADNLAC
jgi:hypothetical protein